MAKRMRWYEVAPIAIRDYVGIGEGDILGFDKYAWRDVGDYGLNLRRWMKEDPEAPELILAYALYKGKRLPPRLEDWVARNPRGVAQDLAVLYTVAIIAGPWGLYGDCLLEEGSATEYLTYIGHLVDAGL